MYAMNVSKQENHEINRTDSIDLECFETRKS